MSETGSVLPSDDAVLDEVLVEDVVAVSPAQRALEVAAFILALASLFLLLYNLLYLYTAVQLQKAQGSPAPSFQLLIQYFQTIVAQQAYVLALLPLLALSLVAVIRGVWPSLSRSRDRTVVTATFSLIVGLVTLVVGLYNAVDALFTDAQTSQLGTSAEARLTAMTGNLFAAVLAIGTIAIGAIFIIGRNTEDDAEALTEDDAADVDPEPVAVESSTESTSDEPKA